MNEEMFECIRCGAQVYHAALHCPHCGLDLYPEEIDGDALPEDPLPPLTMRRFSPGSALFICAILSAFLTYAWLPLHIVFPYTGGLAAQAIPLIAGSIAALAAGYGTCALLRKMRPLHGLLLGAFSTLNAVVLVAFWREMAFSQALFHPLTLEILALCLLCGIAGQFTYAHLLHRANHPAPAPESAEDSLYVNLLHRVGFDQARLERLVEQERRSAPRASRNDLLSRAIARWDRDNR